MSNYTKLFGTILDSTIWSEPQHVKVVWITLLAMSDTFGFVKGFPDSIRKRAQVSPEECTDALHRLSSPDPNGLRQPFEGRRIKESEDGCGYDILNHGKYYDLLSPQDILDKKARRNDRQNKRRAEAKADKISTPTIPQVPIELSPWGKNQIAL